MKNKLKKTMTALCAALILMGVFSVPAYAQGAADRKSTRLNSSHSH